MVLGDTVPYLCEDLGLLLAASISSARSGPLLLRKPALSRTQIVFTYAGDLWSVPREGGEARRLTAGPGHRNEPGLLAGWIAIAFTGEYDGNVDVFVIPAAGGVPQRLTYHPGRDGAVAGRRTASASCSLAPRGIPTMAPSCSPLRVEGGDAGGDCRCRSPIEGSYSPDGTHLAYVPIFQWQDAWKRYRGGQTRKIWIANLADSSIVPIPRENSNDFNPMWIGDQDLLPFRPRRARSRCSPTTPIPSR